MVSLTARRFHMLQFRNDFLLAVAVMGLVLFAPTAAKADCTDLIEVTNTCSNSRTHCNSQYTRFFCSVGCIEGLCNTNHGLCCGRAYISNGISPEPPTGECKGLSCGLARHHVAVLPKNELGIDASLRIDRSFHVGRFFVPDRCAHAYRLLEIRESSKTAGGF